MSSHVLTSLKIQSFLSVAKQSLKQRMRPQVRARRKATPTPTGTPADPAAFFAWSLERHKEAHARQMVISGDNGRLLPEISALAPHLRKLCIRHTPITNIAALRGLPNLQALEITASPVTDLSPLADLPELTELKLSLPSEIDVTLPDLPNLRRLKISHPGKPVHLGALPRLEQADLLALCDTLPALTRSPNLTDLKTRIAQGQSLTSLAQADALTTLSLRCDGKVDIAPLANLQQLDTLDLFGADTTDLTALGSLPALTTLSLWNTPAIRFDALSQAARLENLTIQSLGLITDLSFVSSLSALNHLSIGAVSHCDLAPVASLRKLAYLLLQSADPDLDLGPLEHCDTLRTLHFQLTDDTDHQMRAPWPELPNLQNLSLSGTNISSINGLQRCRLLKNLSCTGTAVNDLYPLRSLPYLEQLDISGSQVADLSVLLTLPKFTKPSPNCTLALNDTPALQSMHELDALAASSNGRDYDHARHLMANRVVVLLQDQAAASSEGADA
ncbi:leucine-rich repeat domain-containing protein [uncultured Shimia sp.]|uniref:leucine-rich repeat domain-containing protein n=1 Tax=uncultured Shimia sp. TaxID=573152 RepID=UPI00263543C2|nr:leucine-rich repeat domain-containing protein [uncultured Shimia sp.]